MNAYTVHLTVSVIVHAETPMDAQRKAHLFIPIRPSRGEHHLSPERDGVTLIKTDEVAVISEPFKGNSAP